MILTIKNADFSAANIGTLSTYVVSKSIGSGAAFDIPNFVDKNSSVNWVITLDEGYTFGTYSVTMGSEVITPTVVDNVMTITIAEVTGNVRIVVATVNESGEEDEPESPEITQPTIYRTDRTNGIQIMDFDFFKVMKNNSTVETYKSQIVACDVSRYVGKTLTISAEHPIVKNNSQYGDAWYCFFLSDIPADNLALEALPSLVEPNSEDLDSTSKYSYLQEISESFIVEHFDVSSTSDVYNTISKVVPTGAKYLFVTNTNKSGANKECIIVFPEN